MTGPVAPWAAPASVVLVTGATGFAGRHLLDRLARSPAHVVGWSRASDLGAGSPPLPASVQWVEVDVLDRDAVVAEVASRPPTHVFHLAGIAHAGNSWRASAAPLTVNVLGTEHLFEAFRRLDVRPRVLVSGSALVYGSSDGALDEDSPLGPGSPYALSKLAQEELCRLAWRQDGLPVIVTRSFNHVGPGQHPSFFAASFAQQLARIEAGQLPPVLEVGNLDARRDLTDVRDTVRAYDWLMASGIPGTPYNVCRGEAVVVRAVLDRLIALSGRQVDVRLDPARLRPSDVPVVLGSHRRLTEATGWLPEYHLDDTLRDLLGSWRRQVERPQPTLRD